MGGLQEMRGDWALSSQARFCLFSGPSLKLRGALFFLRKSNEHRLDDKDDKVIPLLIIRMAVHLSHCRTKSHIDEGSSVTAAFVCSTAAYPALVSKQRRYFPPGLKYILEQHYSNPQLSAAAVSEMAGYTTWYLSVHTMHIDIIMCTGIKINLPLLPPCLEI